MQSSSYDGIHPGAALRLPFQARDSVGSHKAFQVRPIHRPPYNSTPQRNPHTALFSPPLRYTYTGLTPSTLRVIFCFCQQKRQSVLRERMRLFPVTVRARRDRTQESHHTALYFNQNSYNFPSRELNNNILQNKTLSLMSRQLIYSLICLRGTFQKPRVPRVSCLRTVPRSTTCPRGKRGLVLLHKAGFCLSCTL